MQRNFLFWWVGLLMNGPVYSQSVPQHQVFLRGKVLDRVTREPLYPASVMENERNLTASGKDGAFYLAIDVSSTITVTFVGYKPAKVFLPSGFTGTEHTTEVLLEKEIFLLPRVNVRKLTKEEFRERFMELNVVTEDEKNARSNLARIWAMANLGVNVEMDGFANFRNYVNGPQDVSIFTLGGSSSKGLVSALKRATTRNQFIGPQRGLMPITAPTPYRYRLFKPVQPPVRADSTSPARIPPFDSLKTH